MFEDGYGDSYEDGYGDSDGSFDSEDLDSAMYRSQDFWTDNPLLHLAVRDGNLPKVRRMLTKCPRGVNYREADGETPLMWAAKENQVDIAKYLIKQGADVSVVSNETKTATMYAASRGSAEVLDVLCLSGCPMDAVDKDVLLEDNNVLEGEMEDERYIGFGWTALVFAIRAGEASCVRVLLEHGASLDILDKEGKTPLQIAHKYQKQEIINILEDEAKKRANLEYLCRLCIHRQLIKHKSTPRQTLKNKVASLPLPAPIKIDLLKLDTEIDPDSNKRGCKDMHLDRISSYSRNRKRDYDSEDSDNFDNAIDWLTDEILLEDSPIHSYVEGGDMTKLRRVLTRYPGMIHGRTRNGETPLMWAAKYDDLEAAKFLIERGADVSSASDWGWTAAMYAARRDSVGVLDLLCLSGCPLDAVDKDQETWYYSIQEKEGEERHIGTGWTALFIAISMNHMNCVRTLMMHGASMDVRDKEGKTALEFAKQKLDESDNEEDNRGWLDICYFLEVMAKKRRANLEYLCQLCIHRQLIKHQSKPRQTHEEKVASLPLPPVLKTNLLRRDLYPDIEESENSDPISDTITDANSDSDTNEGTDLHPDIEESENSDPISEESENSDRISDTNTDTNSDSDTNTDTDADSDI